MFLRTRRKRRGELAYWRSRAQAEGGRLAPGAWYEAAFTTTFGLPREFYAGKALLDVGCGPRGSLEWASDAARRVGLDPLVEDYGALPRDAQAMEYVAARSERMPFPDATFDVVSCFNALDHVESPEETAAEIVRVLAPGATFLLLVMVGHPATALEPHELHWDCVGLFAPPLVLEDERRYADTRGGDLYGGLADARPYADSGVGLLAARFSKP